MGADLQPHIHSKISQGIHRGDKLNRLSDAVPPMNGVAVFAGAPPAAHRAEERGGFFLRLEICQGLRRTTATSCIIA